MSLSWFPCSPTLTSRNETKAGLRESCCQPRAAATTQTIENTRQSELKFHTAVLYKLLLFTLLFHGLSMKVQSARLDLRLSECLTSQTALLLDWMQKLCSCLLYVQAQPPHTLTFSPPASKARGLSTPISAPAEPLLFPNHQFKTQIKKSSFSLLQTIKKTDQNAHPGRLVRIATTVSHAIKFDLVGEHAVGKHAGVTPLRNKEMDGAKNSELTQL